MTRPLPTVAAAAAALALLAPSAASAGWLPVEEVGTSKASDQEIRTAANDRGDAILLWRDNRGIQVAVSRRGGELGAPRRVPGSAGGSGANLDLNEDGRAIVWWGEFTSPGRVRVKLVGLKVDGGFGRPRVVTPSDPYLRFDPVIGPGGRFAFVYATGSRNRPVYARVAPPSGRLGRRITLTSGAITPSDLWYLGNRPMIAYRQASDDHSRLRERQIGSGGSHVIATVPRNGQLMLDTASNGTQVALWSGGDTEGPERPLMTAVRRAGGMFGKGHLLDNRIPPQETAVAVARSGAAIVAWREWNESTTEDGPSPTPQYTPGRIVFSFRAPGAPFTAMQAFRPDEEKNALIEGLSADIESDGLATLGWNGTRFEGILRRLYTATIHNGETPVVTPMTDFDNLGFTFDKVHIDERERTVFGWIDETSVLGQRGRW